MINYGQFMFFNNFIHDHHDLMFGLTDDYITLIPLCRTRTGTSHGANFCPDSCRRLSFLHWTLNQIFHICCCQQSFLRRRRRTTFPRVFSTWRWEKSTKYVYLYVEYHRVCPDVPSSELGLSHPLSRQRVCPSPRIKGGGHTRLRARGGGVPIPTTGEKA